MFGKKPEIRFIGDLQRLTIGPDDRFVLTCEHRLSMEGAARIQARWAEFAGEGVKLLILDDGAHLGAINVKVQHIPDCAEEGRAKPPAPPSQFVVEGLSIPGVKPLGQGQP